MTTGKKLYVSNCKNNGILASKNASKALTGDHNPLATSFSHLKLANQSIVVAFQPKNTLEDQNDMLHSRNLVSLATSLHLNYIGLVICWKINLTYLLWIQQWNLCIMKRSLYRKSCDNILSKQFAGGMFTFLQAFICHYCSPGVGYNEMLAIVSLFILTNY